MPTRTQDDKFASEMKDLVEIQEFKIDKAALDVAIEWISSNLDPEDVYSVTALEVWARTNGFIKE